MSSGIGTGDINLSTSIQNTEVVGAQNKKQGDSGTVLNKILSKLADGRDFIFGKLGGKVDALITIGQAGGAVAMALGGASLLFSGIAANLTVGGIPLGIPLLAGGAALFAAGTGLLIAKLAANTNSTLGQKIKDFVIITGKNIGRGVCFAGSCLKKIRAGAGASIIAQDAKEKAGEILGKPEHENVTRNQSEGTSMDSSMRKQFLEYAITFVRCCFGHLLSSKQG